MCFYPFAPLILMFFLARTFGFFRLFAAHLRGIYGISSSEYRRSFREGSKMIALASNSKSAQSFMFSEDGQYLLKTAVRKTGEWRELPHTHTLRSLNNTWSVV